MLDSYLWLAAALAVSFSIAAMHATKTLHPPGGATALFAVISGAPRSTTRVFFMPWCRWGAGALG